MNFPSPNPVLGTAIFHLLLLSRQKDHLLSGFTKCLPVWILASEAKNAWVKRGLILSSIGDSFLVFEDKYPICLLFGLASFFLAHLAYIKGFEGPKSASSTRLGIASYTITGLLLGGLVIPDAPAAMRIPIAVYGTVIGTMLWKALDSFVSTGNSKGVFGAIAFAIYDLSLAFNVFVKPMVYEPYLTTTIYYFAQYLIAQVV
jgi:alkenylglycerophosphocholine hydrolase